MKKGIGGVSDVVTAANRLTGGAQPTRVSAASGGGGRAKSSAEDILTFIYTNATSLNNKIPELTARLNTTPKPKVVMVTETWFNKCSTPFIGGYNLYQKNREETKNDRKGNPGGGVCIYVCDSVMSVEVCDLSLCSKKVEVVWCEIRCGLDCVLVGFFYRNPKVPERKCQEICRLIRNAKNEVESNKYTLLMIAGDFNFPKSEVDRWKWIIQQRKYE